MNIIFIMSDTVRWDHLGYNGNDVVKTPCLDRLASQAYVFDQAFLSSYPTVPNRWDILTGKLNFTYTGWQPLDPGETVLPERLADAGYVSMMIADTPHILAKGFNYQRGFDGWEWVRGQENDAWRTAPRQVEYPCDPSKLRSANDGMVHYLRNVAGQRREEDHFAPRTLQTVCDWLERNHDQGKFFLYVDTFDPHEPWDPPRHYVDMYDPGYEGEEIVYPNYAPACSYTEPEQKHMRALYAGEVTMVDRWIGRVLNKVDELGLAGNTAVCFTSDHGFLHGEHGIFGKSIIDMSTGKLYYEAVPMYDLIVRTPLLIRMPGQAARKDVAGLVQSIDLATTFLDMAGLEADGLHGSSLLPLMHGRAEPIRDIAVSAYPLKYGTPRNCKTMIRDERWALLYSGQVVDPDKELPVPAVRCGDGPDDYQLGDHRARLFDVQADPAQTHDVIRENEAVARDLHARYVEFLRNVGTSEEALAVHRDFALEP